MLLYAGICFLPALPVFDQEKQQYEEKRERIFKKSRVYIT